MSLRSRQVLALFTVEELEAELSRRRGAPVTPEKEYESILISNLYANKKK